MDYDYLGADECPECRIVTEFEAMGPYRARCTNCEAIVKTEELEIIKRRRSNA